MKWLVIPLLIIALLPTLSVDNEIPQQYIYYQVKAGDTLWDISKKYMPNVDPRRGIEVIRDTNGMPANYIIKPGDILNVPSKNGPHKTLLGQE